MKIFKKMNVGTDGCVVCEKKTQKPVTLIPIEESIDAKSFNVEAVQVHIDCIELWYRKSVGLFYQKIDKEKKKPQP